MTERHAGTSGTRILEPSGLTESKTLTCAGAPSNRRLSSFPSRVAMEPLLTSCERGGRGEEEGQAWMAGASAQRVLKPVGWGDGSGARTERLT